MDDITADTEHGGMEEGEGGGEEGEDGEDSDVKIRYKYVAVDGAGQEIDEEGYSEDDEYGDYHDEREVISYNEVVGEDGEVYQELGRPRGGGGGRGRGMGSRMRGPRRGPRRGGGGRRRFHG